LLQEIYFYLNSKNITDNVNNILTSIQCNGVYLLRYIDYDEHDDGNYLVLFAISMLIFGCIFILIAVYIGSQKIYSPNWLYGITILIGSSINYLAIIVFYMKPDSNTVCISRPVLTIIGYTLTCCAIFFRSMQMLNVYQRSKNVGVKSLDHKKVYLGILIAFIIFQTIYLIIWNTVDTYHWYHHIDSRAFIETYGCYSKQLGTWLGIEIAIFASIYLALTITIYKTWYLLAPIIPSFKWILLANYNLILTFIVMIPLVMYVIQNDADVYVLFTIAILFTTTGTVLSLLLPQIPCLPKENTRGNDYSIMGDRSNSAYAYKLSNVSENKLLLNNE